jgi:hypothetical protein
MPVVKSFVGIGLPEKEKLAKPPNVESHRRLVA